ncbi:MAG: class II aldolase/adducin family protein [Candidatus Brocadiia bacterium]
MNDDLRDMIHISRTTGADQRLVQGGGGNTSVKTDGGRRMYVKASGTALGEMEEGSGYRLVDVDECVAILEDEDLGALEADEREAAVLSRLLAACEDDLPGRPSVETSLHAMLGRCVVHTHPSVVNGLLCAQKGREALRGLFGQMSPPYLYIEWAGAGYVLADRMKDELAGYEDEHGRLPEVIFLENHGLFVTTEQADRALGLTESIFETIQQAAEQAAAQAGLPEFTPPAPELKEKLVEAARTTARGFYAEVFGGPAVVGFTCGEAIADLLRMPDAEQLAAVPPLTPDQVVYCREHPVWVAQTADPAELAERLEGALAAAEAGTRTPLCVLIEGLGLLCAAPNAKLLDTVQATMAAAAETLTVAALFGGPRSLDAETVEWMRNWEVERFRHQMAAGQKAERDRSGP